MKHTETTQTTVKSILEAANRVMADRGADGFTLEAVAREASISKGGLLYHFPSKKKLIEGMLAGMIAQVEGALAEELSASGGDYLTAYIQASFRTNVGPERINQAFSAAMADDPRLVEPLRAHFRRMQEEITAAAPSPEIGTLIRLALDGLWMSDLYGFAPPSPELREKMKATLLAIAKAGKGE